jgi:hypothetical protein
MASYGLLPKDTEKIDTIGYQTRGELYLKHIHQAPDVDTMIAAGRKNILDHERMVQEAREHKKNTEMTLGKIVEMFLKGQILPIEDQKKMKRQGQKGRGGMFQSKADRNTQVDLPKNTQRTTPSNFSDIKSGPGRGGSNNCRGGSGRAGNGGRGGAHAPPGAEGRWQGNCTSPSIADNQHVPPTLNNGEAAQGATINDNGDWPALGSLPSRCRHGNA